MSIEFDEFHYHKVSVSSEAPMHYVGLCIQLNHVLDCQETLRNEMEVTLTKEECLALAQTLIAAAASLQDEQTNSE